MANFSIDLNSMTLPGKEVQHIENVLKILFEQALSERVFPGGATGILIDRPGKKETYVYTAGYTDQRKKFIVSEKTFFDLASLTKPLVTSLSILTLIEMGKLDFNTPLKAVLRGPIPAPKRDITVGDLLQHKSGLPAHKPYFLYLNTYEELKTRKEKIVEYILAEPLDQQPRKVSAYSDLGFILLGHIIELVASEPLEVFWSKNITIPLSLQDKLFFQPLLQKVDIKKIAATEKCQWMKRMLCGEVHDENCRSLGGIAGHAGLFGTVGGVMELCGFLLRTWRGEKILSQCPPQLLKKTFGREENEEWCYGFDTPSGEKSSSGKYFSRMTVGHLGFTGTSFWIDLCRGVVIVLLTNRVHPSRENEKIKNFRPVFHDRLMEILVKS